jgi:hypothetical protein
MQKTYSFKEQLEIAKQYEEKILAYYNTLAGCVNVTDLTDKQKYRDYDIDFLFLRLHAGIVEAKTIEIKVDFRLASTNNFFIELSGWYEKCKAEVILYVDAHRKLGYHLENRKLHDFINQHKDEYETRDVGTSDFGGFSVTGLLVPREDILKYVIPYTEDLSKAI